MNSCFLPTISEILALEGVNNGSHPSNQTSIKENYYSSPSATRRTLRLKAEQEWYGAIAALNRLLQQETQRGGSISSCPTANSQFALPQRHRGVVLSGPSSILTNPVLASSFASWIFTGLPDSDRTDWTQTRSLPLLPAPEGTVCPLPDTPALPLMHGDPLTQELFCLVLTDRFSLVMVLGETPTQMPTFLFSFDPEVVTQAWVVLRQRVKDTEGVLINSDLANFAVAPLANCTTKLDALFEEFTPIPPSYKTVMQFSRLILQHLPCEEDVANKGLTTGSRSIADSLGASPHLQSPAPNLSIPNPQSEVELLQAIAHEVRTPLATIRTLTRLLLKRPNLDPIVAKRLETIDAECTAQIDRFSLIFRAVELEASQTKQCPMQLTAMSLSQVVQSNLSRWQKQASQRNHTLEVTLPQNLPTVVSDPTMLDQVLTGLIENFTRSLPVGSHIQVGVMLAGNQLKLQLESQYQPGTPNEPHVSISSHPSLKSIGPLLMVQPETGSLSLNLKVTKNLFKAAGGRLVVRQRPQKGEVMTIFLPLQ